MAHGNLFGKRCDIVIKSKGKKMRQENLQLYSIFKIVFLLSLVFIFSSCASAALIAGQAATGVAVNKGLSELKNYRASGETVEDLGNGQYRVTVIAKAEKLGERFKAKADEIASQNGYKAYDVTNTAVSKRPDSGGDLSLLTGIIVCRQ